MRRNLLASAVFIILSGAALALVWTPDAGAQFLGHDCAFCHNLHGATGSPLLSNAQVEALCMTCHGPAGPGAIPKADVHTNKTPKSSYPPFRVSCRGCHNAHDNMANWQAGTNIRLVGAVTSTRGFAGIRTVNSGTRDVVFESRGSTAGGATLHSFADSDEDNNGYYDGICEDCHTLVSHHTNNAPDTAHHTGDTCTRCHLHTNQFLK